MSPIAIELDTPITSPLHMRSLPPFSDNPRHRRSITPVEGCTLAAAIPSSEPELPSRHRRSSIFFEAGLQGEDAIIDAKVRRFSRPKLQVRFSSEVDVVEPDVIPWIPEPPFHTEIYEPMPPYFPTLPRLLFLALVIALLVPSLSNSPMFKAGISPLGAKARTVDLHREREMILPKIRSSEEVPDNVCRVSEHNMLF